MSSDFPSGVGQSAVEFDDSAEAGAVESRLSLIRTLIGDVARAEEEQYTQDITFDGRIWRVSVQRVG